MQVRRNRNLVECIMDSEDLEKYDLDIDELKDPSSKDKIGDRLQEILDDINDELDDDEKMEFNGPLSVEMMIGNAESVLIRIHSLGLPEGLDEAEEQVPNFKNQKKSFDKDEKKDLSFSFKTLGECITFAKQLNWLSESLIQKAKGMKEEDLVMTKDEDLEIPDYIPEMMQGFFEKLRHSVTEKINEVLTKSYEEAKNFDGLDTSLYKMNDVYYFICRNISFYGMNGIAEEFYLNDITSEPLPSYIEEHGEVIIKEKAVETLTAL